MLLSHEGLFSTSVHDTYIIDYVNQSMPHLISYTLYTNYRSNHLNGPDYDSLETSSVASGSSAYSSKEDSLSPTLGSVTELSDVGSVDSFLEYDIQRSKVRNIVWMLHNVTGPLPDLIGELTVQSTFCSDISLFMVVCLACFVLPNHVAMVNNYIATNTAQFDMNRDMIIIILSLTHTYSYTSPEQLL